jgi:8-oxo-dGTP pyrophosphatase MutT (NUDIX family)
METKNDISYGVVPIYKDEKGWQVLLIHQISYQGDLRKFWTIPKGHAEEGETPIEVALRELREETGLQNVTLETKQVFTIEYTFNHEDVRINKQVDFYIGYCDNQKTSITQPEEVMELRWCSFAEALKLVPHQNSKDVLLKVQQYLDT